MTQSPAQVVDLLPVPLRDVSRQDIVDAIADATLPTRSFVGLNAHSFYLLEKDKNFQEVARGAYCFCDGFGVHLLAVLQGLPRPVHRNTPTDFMWAVFARLSELSRTIYLVGDAPGVAAQFARQVEEKYPGLVCGHHHGFFMPGTTEETQLLLDLAHRQPHLLCVGMGQPRQELWVDRHRNRLPCPAALLLGASMAFAVGARRRGPAWATDHGLEWLFRFLCEPREMFFRYFVEIPWLVVRAFRHRWHRR